MKPGYLPLITMFDETEGDSCFAVVELRFCRVLSCNPLTDLWGDEDCRFCPCSWIVLALLCLAADIDRSANY